MNNKTLKLLVLVLTLCAALLLFGTVALAEADECPAGGAHEWDYMGADCTHDADYLCAKCGAYKSEPGTALGHDWGETVPADCENDAYQLCKRCNAKNVISGTALGHDWDEMEADCTHPADRLCLRCGAYETVPGSTPLGHDLKLTETVKAATCVAEGEGKFTCNRCKEVLTQALPIDPNAHQKTAIESVAATCTKAGQTGGEKCALCGKVFTEPTSVPAKGHTWERNGFNVHSAANQTAANGWAVSVKPTTTKTGVGTFTCTDSACDGVNNVTSVTIPKLKGTNSDKSDVSDTVQPTAAVAEELPYGEIVSDAERVPVDYESATAKEIGVDGLTINVLTITALPDEGGAYVLRNLHITDELKAQLASEQIDTVRFVVGKATVEFPVASFDDDALADAEASLTSPTTQYILTVDPTAVTADGAPGCSVSVSVACEDGSEYDVTSLVAELTLTQNKITRMVSVAAVYVS